MNASTISRILSNHPSVTGLHLPERLWKSAFSGAHRFNFACSPGVESYEYTRSNAPTSARIDTRSIDLFPDSRLDTRIGFVFRDSQAVYLDESLLEEKSSAEMSEYLREARRGASGW